MHIFYLQHLLEINVSWCDLISENGVEALSRGCTKLKRFSSKGCKRVNNNAVICLATYCHSLEVLNLHSCDVSVINQAIEQIRNNLCTKSVERTSISNFALFSFHRV